MNMKPIRTYGGWIIVLIILLVSAICSCRSVRYVPVETVRVDSTVIHDTLMDVSLVPYRDSIATTDTISFLSNPYAYSRAEWTGGMLRHTLGIWPTAATRVKVPYFIDRYVTITKPQIVEVEKKLSKWQQFKLDVGGAAIGCMIAVIIIAVGYLIYRLKRRKGGIM